MELLSKDTIVALATAPLNAGVAVIRLSGEKSKNVMLDISVDIQDVVTRKMCYTNLENPRGNLLDRALVVYFETPHSFTGEDVVEIHCHGGQAVINGVLNALTSFEGVRMAQAGEFTRRAFVNGKLDLTEAEGLADLIAAETEEQKNQALRQMSGELGQRFEHWRSEVMHVLAHVEAAIDFPDEELDVLADSGVSGKVRDLISIFEEAIAIDVGERLRQGFSVTIIGKPNAGKSTLTNLLTGRDTAIVSDIAGTTRDVVESHLDIGGYPVVLSDTAGLRETEDLIEKEGVERARKKVQSSDLVLLVVDAESWPEIDVDTVSLLKDNCSLIIVSKVDKIKLNNNIECYRSSLISGEFNNMVNFENSATFDGCKYPVIGVNLKDEESLTEILAALKGLIEENFSKARGAACLTRQRHRQAVVKALEHLQRARTLIEEPHAMSVSELVAQDLRSAASEIGKVTGMTGTEDVLDLVFSTFCIGK